MTELERTLVELGRQLEFPPEPPLAAMVARRIAQAPQRPGRRWVRPLVLGLAGAAAALGIAFAVPPARSAILRLFDVGGVRIERVDELPAVRNRRFQLGDRLTLDEARRRASFPIRLPTADGYGEPDGVYVSNRVPGGLVSFLYGSPARPHALLSELQAGRIYIDKVVGPGTKVEPVTIDGARGYWVTGRPHGFVFVNKRGQIQQGTYRLSANALVWRRGSVTFRLEGKFTKDDAIAVAESIPAE